MGRADSNTGRGERGGDVALRLACRAGPRAEARGRRGVGDAVLGHLLEWAMEEEKRETEGHSGQKHERKRERVFSFSFISNVFQIHLNHFVFWSKPLTSINQMH